MKKALTLFGLATALIVSAAQAQDSYTGTNSTGNWFTARWNNSSDTAPYTNAFTVGNNAIFTSGNYTFTGMGSASNVGNITLLDNVNVTFTSIGSSLATGGNVRTITVGSGSVLDLNLQTYSTAAGTGFTKGGAGVFATGTGSFQGGFTLNAGTVIARGTAGLGSGATNRLTLNGGVMAANATRSFDNTRFGGGIVIGGNVQFGELSTIVTLANSTANLSFANNVSLGSANRTFTLGNQGTQTFSGIISNTGAGGLTFAANAGTAGGLFALTGTSNTFTGNIAINGGEARFSTDGSLGNIANDIIVDGGVFSMATGTTNTIDAARDIFLGDGAGTGINAVGAAGRIIYNGIIADKAGETGSFTHGGFGTLELGGANTYSGTTTITSGVVIVTNGGRLGATTSAVVMNGGTLNLGTQTRTNSSVTISGGVITNGTIEVANFSASGGTVAAALAGSMGLQKTGAATTTLSGVNTYSGATTVSGGTLLIDGNNSGATGNVTVSSGATLGGSGTVGGATTIQSGAFHSPGNSPGLQTFTNGLTYAGGSTFIWELTANTNALSARGTSFDAVDITGGTLTINTGVTNSLVFNGAGSSVVWTNAFWGSDQSWLVFSNAATPVLDSLNVFDSILVGLDSLGTNLTTARPGSSFAWNTIGNDVYLNYTVPEPSTYALLGLAAAGLGAHLIRRRRR